jgi:tripartite-type tricarboxylate transporter receptor subunit TctC
MKTVLLRKITKTACLAGMLALSGAALAQEYPSQPIQLIVPFGPGGSPDVIARLVADGLSEILQKPMVVENRPGASGAIAATAVARAAADGYTVMLTTEGTYAVVPAANPNVKYNQEKDFAPVIHAASGDMFLVVNASLGVETLGEFVDYVKAHPGTNYGSPGKATIHHLGVARLAELAGISVTHVPYRSAIGVLPDLLSNEVSVMFAALPLIAPHLKEGTLKVLAVGSLERSSFLPDVPTIAESGFPGFQIPTNVGFVVPAATPPEIIATLNAAIDKALQSPKVASLASTVGYELVGGDPEAFRKRINEDAEIYRDLVKQTGVTLE